MGMMVRKGKELQEYVGALLTSVISNVFRFLVLDQMRTAKLNVVDQAILGVIGY